MKNRINNVTIPFVLVIFAVACVMALTAATPTTQAGPGKTTLTRYLDAAPAEIAATAKALGIGRIGYVPPRYYTKRVDGIRSFDRGRAEQNLEVIKAICDGATWIISNVEWEHRARVRHPEEYTKAEVQTSVDQYVACWSWFRSRWPSALIFEWNLSNARRPGVNGFAERLVLKHLDGFAISAFWNDGRRWRELVAGSVAHANALVAASADKIVIVGIHERYKIKHEDGIVEFAPVPRTGVDAMIEVALGGDIVFFWSHTHRLLASGGSKKVLTETLNRDAEPLLSANAHVVRVLAEMRLQNEEQTP